jgi:hypothetical protein
MKQFLFFICAAVLIISCGKQSNESAHYTNHTDSSGIVPSDSKAINKVFRINHENTTFEWVAYKFSERKGVKGSFDSITITSQVESGSIEELVSGLTFDIDIKSTNSADVGRDSKIVEYFFGTMLNTDVIKGEIVSYSKTSDYSADASIAITMNGQSITVPAKITILSRSVKLKAILDIGAWDAIASLNALHQECEVLHKSADGLSKIWPDVMISVSAQLQELEPDNQ